MKILIACECSQTVCKAFRDRGHEAYSCDIEPCYGGKPEWHIQRDCTKYIYGDVAFETQNGDKHYVQQFDIVIAHPPCTYLSRVQAPLYNKKRFGNEYVNRRLKSRQEAINFFLLFTRLSCMWCIENPPGLMSKLYRKPDQTIQPFWFGDYATKATCLWLHNLPLLEKTHIVEPPPSHKYPNSNSCGAWFYETSKLPLKDRARARSKTFDGIAQAMAEQWGNIDNISSRQKEINFL